MKLGPLTTMIFQNTHEQEFCERVYLSIIQSARQPTMNGKEATPFAVADRSVEVLRERSTNLPPPWGTRGE